MNMQVRAVAKQVVHRQVAASGEMVFVTVRHEMAAEATPALVEERDLVYREAPKPVASRSAGAAQEEVRQPEWTRAITPDPVQLFRHSALTFNGHPIEQRGQSFNRRSARHIGGLFRPPDPGFEMIDIDHQNDFGRFSTWVAMWERMRFVEMGAI